MIPFLGGALLFALLAVLPVTALVLRLAPRPEALRRGRLAVALFALLMFLAMTQHPVPNPFTMRCPQPAAVPQWLPFSWIDLLYRMWRAHVGLSLWLGVREAQAAAMNFLICLLIGALLVRAGFRPWPVTIFGAVMTLSIELTQLTGVWWLWPCPWRQFSTEDLLLNFLGMAAGAALMRHRRPSPSLPPSQPSP